MKRFLLSAILLFSLSAVFAQEKIFEGYDGLPWGTTLEGFKEENPSAYEVTDSDDRLRNERLFTKETSSISRVYRFYNEKLYWGRTVYENPDEVTVSAIVEKIRKTYGNFDDSKKGTDLKNREYFVTWKNISKSFSISLEYYGNYNSYGRISSTNLYLSYENSEIRKEVDQYEKEQKMKNIEL